MNQELKNQELNLVDLFHIVLKRKLFLAIFVGTATVLAIVVSLLLPPSYLAKTVLLPMSDNKGAGGLGALLKGSLPMVGGALTDGGTGIMPILESRTLAERVIEECDLLSLFFPDISKGEKGNLNENATLLEAGVAVLRGKVNFIENKKTETITITSEFNDPVLAAKVANSYVEFLQDFLHKHTLTLAKKNRIFIEGQLVKNKLNLLDSGKKLSGFYGRERVSSTNANVGVTVDLSEYVNDASDDGTIKEINTEIKSLLSEEQKIEDKLSESKATIEVPQQVYLEYLVLQRELLSKVSLLLSQQYEMAKIEEAKNDISFQVVDVAKPPTKKYKPQRSIIVLATLILSSMLGITLVFILNARGKKTKMLQE